MESANVCSTLGPIFRSMLGLTEGKTEFFVCVSIEFIRINLVFYFLDFV